MWTNPAPPSEYYQPTEFRVGRALSRAFEVLARNFVTFAAISAVPTLPSVLFATQTLQHQNQTNVWLQLLVNIALSSLCEAMIIYATFQALRGRPVRAGESIARGLQRFGPVFIASILVAIVVGIGFILLIVPGLIALTVFAVVIPVCVVEQRGPTESMSRSGELTKGYRWPIFGALFAVAIVSAIIGAVIGASALLGGLVLYGVLTFITSVVVTAYQTVLTAIIYHDLRVVKEGIDLDQIASVFD